MNIENKLNFLVEIMANNNDLEKTNERIKIGNQIDFFYRK